MIQLAMMPVTSKRQFRFMQAVAHGSAKAPGLSKSEAAEYVRGQSPKALPESAPKKKRGLMHVRINGK